MLICPDKFAGTLSAPEVATALAGGLGSSNVVQRPLSDGGPGFVAVLAASLLIGTPVLSLLGAACAALALGARGGGVLLALLALPLFVPVLIFGAGAADAQAASLSPLPHLSLLGAGLILAVMTLPFAMSAAIRIAVD